MHGKRSSCFPCMFFHSDKASPARYCRSNIQRRPRLISGDYRDSTIIKTAIKVPSELANSFSEFIRELVNHDAAASMYGDNVFEKDGIRRDRTGDGEKTRCLCGKRGIFNRDGPAMGPQIIRQLERRASRRSASFFHALASPGRPRNGGGASGAYQPAEGRKP